MFDLKKALSEWKRSLRKLESFEDGTIMELESHLLDEFDKQKQNGLTEEEAFARAAAAVGRPEDVGGEYFKDSQRSRLNVPPWQKTRFSSGLALNYLKVAWRRLLRQKGYSFINILGLAVGLAGCIMIYLWTQDAIGYNRFHKNAGDLYRVYIEMFLSNGSSEVASDVSVTPLARFVKTHCPEALATARIASANELAVKVNGKLYAKNSAGFVDPPMLKMFSFEPLRGDLETALSDKYSCLLTEESARRFFGDTDALGRILTIEKTDFRVSGIIKAFPRQSDYHFDMVFQYGLYWGANWQDSDEMKNWGGNPLETYVQLQPGVRPAALEKSLNEAFTRTMAKNFPEKVRFGLQPLSKIHLENPQGEGLIRFVPLFSIAALIILFIACINFITLTTARSHLRAKEIGMRKVIGAGRGSLIRQFFGESLLIAAMALVLALLMVYILLPHFSQLVGTNVSWDIHLDGTALWQLAAVILLVGLVAGGYPALAMSGLRPLTALKAVQLAKSGGSLFHKVLVVAQFSLSVFLIFFTMAHHRQLRFIEKKDMGFDRENIISLSLGNIGNDAYESLKTEILRHPAIQKVTRALENPAYVGSTVRNGDWPGKNPDLRVALTFMFVDFDFIETFRMQMASGRSFKKDFPADPGESYIINETAAKLMGLANPVGQRLSIFQKPGTIIGVVRDFHFQPLNFTIQPLVIGMGPDWKKRNAFIRIAPAATGATINFLEKAWKKFNPGHPWSFSFFSDGYRDFYRGETIMGKIADAASVMAILISCLGLFAMASFSVARQTKEIGIRKVFGAPTGRIMLRLTMQFMKWVVLANLIALPLANHFTGNWLQRFAYRRDPDASTFAFSFFLALAIALLTTGYQTMRAARANPVDSLRYE